MELSILFCRVRPEEEVICSLKSKSKRQKLKLKPTNTEAQGKGAHGNPADLYHLWRKGLQVLS